MSSSNDRAVLLQKASYLLDVNRPQQAFDLLTEVLAVGDGDPTALCLSARVELALGRDEQALAYARRAAAAAPDAEWPLRLQAISAIRLGRRADAVQAARAAVMIDPRTPETHRLLAEILIETEGDLTKAWAAARYATELEPTDAISHATMGRVALAFGDEGTARRALNEALRLDPIDGNARNDLGRLDLRQMEPLSAAAHFATAAASGPELAVAIGNVDVALSLAVSRVSFFVGLLTIVPGLAAAFDHGSVGVGYGLLLFALLAAVLCYDALRLRSALRGGLRRCVRHLPARDRSLTWSVRALAGGTVALAVLGLAPPGPIRLSLYPLAVGGVVAARFILAVRRRQRDSRTMPR